MVSFSMNRSDILLELLTEEEVLKLPNSLQSLRKAEQRVNQFPTRAWSAYEIRVLAQLIRLWEDEAKKNPAFRKFPATQCFKIVAGTVLHRNIQDITNRHARLLLQRHKLRVTVILSENNNFGVSPTDVFTPENRLAVLTVRDLMRTIRDPQSSPQPECATDSP